MIKILKYALRFESKAMGQHPLAKETYQILEEIGGVVNANYLREGMRDLSEFRKLFEDKTPEEAEAIATGREGNLPPIEIAIERLKNGLLNVVLVDGRHRSTAAREAGAELIQARITHWVYNFQTQEYEALEEFNAVVPLGKNIEKYTETPQGATLERLEPLPEFNISDE